MSKYHNKKTIIDGITFDSKAEGNMYLVLKTMQKTGKINFLKLQPEYELQEGFKGLDGKKVRPILYRADFSFYDCERGQFRVLDCKGMKTKEFRIKEKMFNKIMLGQGIQLEFNI